MVLTSETVFEVHHEGRTSTAARYPFVASVTLIDLESDHKTVETTRDLSLFGCHVVPGNFWTTGTRLRLQVIHKGEVFEALGRAVNARPTLGIGIVFTRVEGASPMEK
jgi:hypothetical protein